MLRIGTATECGFFSLKTVEQAPGNVLPSAMQRNRIIGIQPGGLDLPEIDEFMQLVEIVFLFFQ
ncbi:hypothetical protein D3C81_1718080 [compost metagenome]